MPSCVIRRAALVLSVACMTVLPEITGNENDPVREISEFAIRCNGILGASYSLIILFSFDFFFCQNIFALSLSFFLVSSEIT